MIQIITSIDAQDGGKITIEFDIQDNETSKPIERNLAESMVESIAHAVKLAAEESDIPASITRE